MNVPPGIFRRVNTMTPYFIEEGCVPGAPGLYYRIETDGGRWARYVEEPGPCRPLIGVTIRDGAGQDPEGLSAYLRSLDEARGYIENIGREKP